MATTLPLLSPGVLTFIDSTRPSINNRTGTRQLDFWHSCRKGRQRLPPATL